MRIGSWAVAVFGVLLGLALLATTLLSMQSLERQVARNYLDGMRAKQVARSGIEFAYARLMEGLNAGQLGEPAFVRALTYESENAPLETATSPSFAVESTGGHFGPLEAPQNPTDDNFTPRHIWLRAAGGKPVAVGFSGLINNDTFSLSVRDASGMIHVNDGVTESASFGAVTKNLKRILNRLGQIPSIGIAGLGDAIVGARPPGGYRSKRELVGVLGEGAYRKIAPFVTAHAWVDRGVANPVPLSGDPSVLNYYNSFHPGSAPAGSPAILGHTIYFRGHTPRYRYGWRKDFNNALVNAKPNLLLAGQPGLAPPDGLTHAVYGMDELNVRYVEITSRAPVNVNVARREVLAALLADLCGFWVQERRRDVPPAAMPATAWRDVAHTYSPSSADEGDEFGFLIASDPIAPAAALAIADEMIAGRPFRTWRQFHAFCDGLVERGVVKDSRVASANALYYWHRAPATNAWGTGLTASGEPALGVYRRQAAQAIADAIKANFNPNLHLNETNPDENMTLMIDKTDLICASTEGCFMPTGYYEIESLGRVARAPAGGPLAATAGDPCELIAEFKIEAVVKLFDAMRFTSQRDFHGSSGRYWRHEAAGVQPSPDTNNRLTVEIGPEPDWGAAPEENEWGGYIAWPTNGTELAAPKPPGTLIGTTGDLGSDRCNRGMAGCVMHGHFTASDFLQHGVDGTRHNLNRWSIGLAEANECWPDHQAESADVGVLDGFKGYRLARSFRVPDASGAGVFPDLSGDVAPLDHRIDGVYLERHTTLGYWMASLVPEDIVFAYWLKPRYAPETTGKIRQYWNWSRIDERDPSHNPVPMTHFYSPSRNHFLFLNRASSASSPELSRWRRGRWIHFMHGFTGATQRMTVNGETTTSTREGNAPTDWSYHVSAAGPDGAARNLIRIGEADKYGGIPASPVGAAPTGVNPATRNFAPDATFDEYYLVAGRSRAAEAELLAIANRGRYYIPRRPEEGLYESPDIALPAGVVGGRSLPPPSVVSAPGGGAPVPWPGGRSPRILGVSWTAVAEHADLTLTDTATQAALHPRIEASIRVDGVWYGPYGSEFFSPVRLPSTGAPVPVTRPDEPLRLRMKFGWVGNAPGPGARVLATPYVDDVTLFFDAGDSGFVDYHVS